MHKNELKSKQVYNVLITPIECSNKRKYCEEATIEKRGDIIYSTQLYKGILDCDMTDFACGFYLILYKDFLEKRGVKSVVNQKQELSDVEFAGDTMNSFNNIANSVKEAGRSRTLRTDEDTWPSYLKEYKHAYHCLANFWLVPMQVGRTMDNLSKAQCTKDYMDGFLRVLKKDFCIYEKQYPKYFSSIDENPIKFADILEIHFLKDSYIQNDKIKNYSNGKPEEIITTIHQLNKQRAESIAKSNKVCELWEYFDKYGLIN